MDRIENMNNNNDYVKAAIAAYIAEECVSRLPGCEGRDYCMFATIDMTGLGEI